MQVIQDGRNVKHIMQKFATNYSLANLLSVKLSKQGDAQVIVKDGFGYL